MPDFANLTDCNYQALHVLGNSELVPIPSKYLIGKKGIFKIVNNGYPIPMFVNQRVTVMKIILVLNESMSLKCSKSHCRCN